MKDIEIKISRETRKIIEISKLVIGNDGENLQGNLVFSFSDEFVKGQARLEYVLEDIEDVKSKKYLPLMQVNETYGIPIKSILTKEGKLFMQLVITEGTSEEEIPVFKSNVFFVKIKESINAEIEEPDKYPTLIEIANTKLNQIDNLDISAVKVDNVATITITDKNGNKNSVEIYDGEQGPRGIQGPQGVQGPKPVKGVDYYTDEEKTEFVESITTDANSKFNKNANEKTTTFNDNANSKLEEFNENATTKLNEFNENYEEKLNDFFNNTYNRPYFYENIETMKSSKVKSGSFVRTLGYYSANDGGGADYLIREKTDTDVEDGGSIHFLENGLVAELIVENVNSKQFGILDNLDNTVQLQRFFDYANEKFKKEVVLIGANYTISDTININPRCFIKLKGRTVINDLGTGIGFNIINSSSDEILDLMHRYLFDNSNGEISLINNNSSIDRIGVMVNSVGNKRLNLNINGIAINSYSTGMILNTIDTYIMKFSHISICDSNVALQVGYVDENGNKSPIQNSGENILFSNCVFTQNNCCADFIQYIKIKFENCSFDFNGLVFYMDTFQGNVLCDECWFEGVGIRKQEKAYYKDVDGIVWCREAPGASFKNHVQIINSDICYLHTEKYPNYIFQGSSLLLTLKDNLFWYAEPQWNNICNDIKCFLYQFLCHDNVRFINYSGNNFKTFATPMIQSKLNVLDSYFSNMPDIDSYLTYADIKNIDFGDFVQNGVGQLSDTQVKTTIVDDRKCIELKPNSNGGNATLNLITKNYFPLKGNKFDAIAFVKGFKNFSHTSVRFDIELYDKDLNKLNHEIGIISSTSRADSSGITNDNWFSTVRHHNNIAVTGYVIPANAVYYRVKVAITPINGTFEDTVIDNKTVTYSDPVYVTGLHFYNYD